jgi:hypothetical protein
MHPNATRRADSVISTWMGTATADDDETRSSLAILQSVPSLTIKTVWIASMPLAATSQASATTASRCANGNGTQLQDLVVVEFGLAAGTASSRVVSTLCCFLRTVACVCVRVRACALQTVCDVKCAMEFIPFREQCAQIISVQNTASTLDRE